MKKIILFVTATFFAWSCATKNSVVAPSTNVVFKPTADSRAESKFKGNWSLTKVSYVGKEYFKLTSFQLADSNCFEGSVWNFISNNEKGSVVVSKANCASFSSAIVWSVNKEKMFTLKILNDLVARDVKQGFYFSIQNQTEASFELVDKVNVGGKLTEVVYRFEKNN